MAMKRRVWLYLMMDGKYRCWQDFERFGFLSAGHDAPPSGPIRKMGIGDLVYAYSHSWGYFARGTVTAPAVRPREFIVKGPFVHLQDGSPAGDELPLDRLYTKRSFLRNDQDTDLSEFVVGVKWDVVLPSRRAKAAQGLQVPEIAAVELNDSPTEEFLTHAFGRVARP
jgi:hypothetical protein